MIELCRLEDIADGDARGFDPFGHGKDSMFLVRRGLQVHGWQDECPHIAGSPLAWRKNAYLNASRTCIVCSGHGAQFDPDSGICIAGACEGQSLRRVAVSIDGEGVISVAQFGHR